MNGGIEAFDYVIIGGGSAGGFLTLRLSEDPECRVLLLEAGGSDRHWSVVMPAAARHNFTGGPRNWCFSTEPEPHMDGRRIFQPRGKVLGGSSSLNGMVYVRGNAKDFDGWEEGGAEGWAYDDVLPYFRKLERYGWGPDTYRGADGPVKVERLGNNHPLEDAFLKAAVEAGYGRTDDYNGANQEGVSEFDANQSGGRRWGTGHACIRPARARRNVVVRTHARATKLLMENGRALGVRYLQNGQERTVYAGREVVLSAGAIQSPHLLMLSGIGPADHLRTNGIKPIVDLPGVGENLQDHLEAHLKFRCPRGRSKNHLPKRHRIVLLGLQWFLFRTGEAATTQSRVGGFLRTDPFVDYPDMQYHFWPYLLDGWSPMPNDDGYTFSVGPVRAESRGWVRLASNDPTAAPIMRLNGLSTEKDIDDFRKAVRITRDIARQPAFDGLNLGEISPGAGVTSDDDIDAYVRQHANSAYHPCGTCKMGTDPMAVVDPKLRVYGVERLRVVDASIMPTITNGNINAPTMMIGEKGADMIRQTPPDA